jgi:hypothetical protein
VCIIGALLLDIAHGSLRYIQDLAWWTGLVIIRHLLGLCIDQYRPLSDELCCCSENGTEPEKLR